MLRRRRPIARAAVVGGAAYYAGKKVQQGQEEDAERDARLDELEAQEGQQGEDVQEMEVEAQPGGISDAAIEQLKQLAELHTQGVLTDDEFAEQKRRLLGES